MTESQSAAWLADLSFYGNEDLVALEFGSHEMLKRTISAIWNEKEFVGMPVEVASGNTIFIPKDAVPLLRKRGLTFAEHPVIDRPRCNLSKT